MRDRFDSGVRVVIHFPLISIKLIVLSAAVVIEDGDEESKAFGMRVMWRRKFRKKDKIVADE